VTGKEPMRSMDFTRKKGMQGGRILKKEARLSHSEEEGGQLLLSGKTGD